MVLQSVEFHNVVELRGVHDRECLRLQRLPESVLKPLSGGGQRAVVLGYRRSGEYCVGHILLGAETNRLRQNVFHFLQ